MHCPNCGRELGCGCEIVKATDGSSCCIACVGAKNQKIKEGKNEEKKNNRMNKRFIV